MKSYLRAYDGRKCELDLDRPFVLLKAISLSANYNRGNIVYPIADREGNEPGDHFSEGYITISTPNTNIANFLGVEIDKGGIFLSKLLRISGERTGISHDGRRFYQEGRKMGDTEALSILLDDYNLTQLPEELRDNSLFSRIVSSSPTSHERGIILDSLEEVEYILTVFESGNLIASAKATENKFYEDQWKGDHPSGGVDDPTLLRQTKKALFVEECNSLINRKRGSLVDRIIAELKAKGEFHKDYDYDAMGTSFFKTSVDIKQVDGKYVLGLWAAYVGDEPEKELAEVLQRERALVKIGSSYELEPLSKEWAIVNLDEALKNGILSSIQKSFLASLAANEYGDIDYPIDFEGVELVLKINLGQVDNFRPYVTRAGGNKLFLKLEEDKGKPYFSFDISLPEKSKSAVLPEEKIKMSEVRDSLDTLITTNLLK